MKAIAYISAILILITSCQRADNQDVSNIVSIASLGNIETNYRSVLITENIIIEGIITANDEYGEFYNCLIIEDQSAALKIMCDMSKNYRQFPIGKAVRVSCSGLYLLNHYRGITLGAEPTGEYTLDYIAQDRIGQYIKLHERSDEPLEPTTIAINELTPLHIYSYARLEEVTISNNEGITTFCTRDAESGLTINTKHTITDRNDNTMELFVNRWCRYANAQLPIGKCNISVIIDYYDGQYSATITNCDYQLSGSINQ